MMQPNLLFFSYLRLFLSALNGHEVGLVELKPVGRVKIQTDVNCKSSLNRLSVCSHNDF